MGSLTVKICTCCIILYVTFNLIYYGGTEYYRARTYVENVCQVTKSDIDDSSCGEQKEKDCYQPVWAVLYDKPDIDDEPVQGEIHSEKLLSLKDANSQVDQYVVDRFYKCYHNKALDVVQWERPSKRDGVIRLVLGLLLVPLVFGCYCLYRVHRKRTQQNNRSTSPTASVDGGEQENIARAADDPNQ